MTAHEAGRNLAAAVRAIAEELQRAGVHDVVICPGSRSTPLALAIAVHPDLRTWVHVDERAGAFFALGLAMASRRPTAVLTTSGTAAVNLAPAVVEASGARVPLILLTADRPPELRDRGANQTIDQADLYGRFTKWYAELPLPDGSPRLERHLRGTIGRAVATATEAPPGPVQLDVPFREPLVPDGSLAPMGPGDGPPPAPFAQVVGGIVQVDAEAVARLARRLAQAQRPLIVCGPLDEPGFADAVAQLADRAAAPILADALSNVRVGHHDRSHVILRPDALARSDALRERFVPDLVLRFGAAPTSKAVGQMLETHAAPQIVVDEGGWTEPTLLPVTMVHATPSGFAVALADALDAIDSTTADPLWLEGWRAAGAAADLAMRDQVAQFEEAFEGAVFSQLEGVLPDGTILFAGNSMPVRDMDAFLVPGPAAIRCIGNRGASGIDGLVSTALGAAAADDGPVVLVVGDISFLHDLNALVALRGERPALTVVLMNNDGGGIFSFLPQTGVDRPDVGLPAQFERLFGTPHGLDLGAIVRAFGVEHRVLAPDELGKAVGASLARAGVRVLELRSDRTRNVELHHEVSAAASAAIERALAGDGAGS